MHLALNAEVTVIGKRTFANLADVENPAENLVGVAQSASQGAITARQLDVRPIMRQGEVLETVPGVIITQHSGEGKANQYFLRGFNLDHGSDFAQTIAGTPVNMPTHAHSQGYSDINFLIPELVAGVQFSKGPYFADQGDFATAGASNINYATTLDRPIVHVENGHLRLRPGVLRRVTAGRSRAICSRPSKPRPTPVRGRSPTRTRSSTACCATARATTSTACRSPSWAITESGTPPKRRRSARSTEGLIDRFGSIDPTDGGHTYRYSLGAEWQHSGNKTLTKVTAYGLAYDLDLISNFTFFLDDPVHGDQQEQVDHRFVTGVKVSHRRLATWWGRAVQNTFGVQIRNDDIPEVGALPHRGPRAARDEEQERRCSSRAPACTRRTRSRGRPGCARSWAFGSTRLAHRVDALDPANSGTSSAGIVSPKAGVTLGPWKGTEFYVNAGTGFHSNNALGTTITRDVGGNPVDRVTPLVRADGRGVRRPHRRHSASADHGLAVGRCTWDRSSSTTATSARPSPARRATDTASRSPTTTARTNGSCSTATCRCRGRVSPNTVPLGKYVPEAVGTVVSAGASIDNFHRMLRQPPVAVFRTARAGRRQLGPVAADHPLNLQGGYDVAKNLRLTADLFNLFDAKVSDIDYYFTSRLPGEPLAGVDDIHFHPAVPRTLRVSMVFGF